MVLSTEKKRKAHWRRAVKKIERLGSWHCWFAWYPVQKNNGDVVWLQVVWRIRIHFRWEIINGKPKMRCNGWWEYK